MFEMPKLSKTDATLINDLKVLLSLPQENGAISQEALKSCCHKLAGAWAAWMSERKEAQPPGAFRKIENLGKRLTEVELAAGHDALVDLCQDLKEISEHFPEFLELAAQLLTAEKTVAFSGAAESDSDPENPENLDGAAQPEPSDNFGGASAPAEFVEPYSFDPLTSEFSPPAFQLSADQDQDHANYLILIDILKQAGLDYAPPAVNLEREEFHPLHLVWKTWMPDPLTYNPARVLEVHRLDRSNLDERVPEETLQAAVQLLANFASSHDVDDLPSVFVSEGTARYHLVFLIYIGENGDLCVADRAIRLRPDLELLSAQSSSDL